MSRRRRLDLELVRRGLVETRAAAREAIDAGLVTVDGAPAFKAARQVAPDQAVALAAPPRPFVSRGGEKLSHALAAFEIDVRGVSALDAGASTGGFTDCLLQAGATRVTAVDVGYGQLHDRLRRDERVTVLERTNVRDLRAEQVGNPAPTLVVADLSFISLAAVLPRLRSVAHPDAEGVVLVKPQFEAGREQVGRGGVVRDPAVWRRCLLAVAEAAAAVGWHVAGATASPLRGPAGNVEFLLRLAPAGPGDSVSVTAQIDAAVTEGRSRREPSPTGARADRTVDADPVPGERGAGGAEASRVGVHDVTTAAGSDGARR